MLIVSTISTSAVHYFMDGRSVGEWSPGAEKLLGLTGPVAAADLRAVLRGCHPHDGVFLPSVRRARRRAGWDLAFCAPKSLSILSRLDPDLAGPVVAAHRGAVTALTAHLDAGLTRRTARTPAGHTPADGLIAAGFQHAGNAADEPHLHTHLVVANLSSAHGQWGAVQATQWFVDRRALAALYQLALRQELRAHGLDLDWRLRPDGLADLADVSRTAVRAASTQGHRAQAEGWGRARSTAQRRAEPALSSANAVCPVMAVSAPAAPAAASPARDSAGGRLEGTVTGRLAVRRSDFRRADVIVTLGACWAEGASPAEVGTWVDRFCAAQQEVPSPTSGRRWTSAVSRRMDEDLARALNRVGREEQPVGRAEEVARAVLAGDEAAASVVSAARALVDGRSSVLAAEPGTCPFLHQAEVLDVAGAMWDRSGLRAAVWATSDSDARRWAVLTGLPPWVPGRPADVVVVDQSDRRPSVDLLRALQAAPRSRFVFVEGGTMPRLTGPASHGLAGALGRLPRIEVAAHRPWIPGERAEGALLHGRPAAGQVLEDWRRRGHPLLVGLGLEEVRGLNCAASRIGPPPADRVVTLRRVAGLPAGSFGERLPESERKAGWDAAVRWSGRPDPEALDRRTARAVGPGWAVTARLAERCAGPVSLFGERSDFPRLMDRAVAHVSRHSDLERVRAVDRTGEMIGRGI